MKIRIFLLLLLGMPVVYSCTNEITVPSEIKPGQEVSISFIAQPDVVVKAGTRVAAADLVTAAKFTFYAFKKETDGTYSFEKEISDSKATYAASAWKSDKALLSVGTYRFLCFYNLPATGRPADAILAAMKGMTWANILDGIVIEHLSAGSNTDVDEFFSGESTGDILISDNNITVVIEEKLKRVVSRIDVKFVKITVDKSKEVSYGDGNDIFGASGDLKNIALNVKGAAKKFGMGATKLSDVWATDLNFNYASPLDFVVFGTSPKTSTFPNSNGSDVNNKEAMAKGIIKGGAYFRGAYILPFMKDKETLKEIKIELTDANDAKRTIVAATELFVQKNFVTLVTVKLQSTTATEGPGDDKEHLFNPKVKFTVTVDNLFGGVTNSDVVVE